MASGCFLLAHVTVVGVCKNPSDANVTIWAVLCLATDHWFSTHGAVLMAPPLILLLRRNMRTGERLRNRKQKKYDWLQCDKWSQQPHTHTHSPLHHLPPPPLPSSSSLFRLAGLRRGSASLPGKTDCAAAVAPLPCFIPLSLPLGSAPLSICPSLAGQPCSR